ncbi:GNAT family N-acetyltransferase [Candidatus Dojkabacteria bacterium]|uniref:GNAT family N-acetyltransferase n=1 Tax=Candidatus Dojkabacteria bacterium TaxID=2099670 RepID=A0A955L889_9BACT|nr:GNAT family N-acetyltransferase [Candidatus Dojkabacteria bacterium]
MNHTLREYNDTDKESLKQMIEKLHDYVLSVDPIKRLRKMPGYVDHALEKLLKTYEENNGKIYLAVDEEKIIGFAFGFVGDTQSEENKLQVIPTQLGIIADLYVEEAYRGTGVAELLMDALEKYLKNSGCDSLWVDVFADNTRALSYYKKRGFVEREIGMLKRI